MKNLRVEVPITECDHGFIPFTFPMGHTEHKGYRVNVLSTGDTLILEFKKGKEWIMQSVRVDDLIAPWIVQVLGEDDGAL